MGHSVRVLDIDLDAFLSDVAHWVRGTRRLNARSYKPWSEDQLRSFLEKNCRLSRTARIPGMYAVHHDKAFDYFRKIADDTNAPLDVVHIDGHADLGMGGSSWVYLTRHVLSLSPERRMNPRRGPKSLNAGSYLAFALATRRIASLKYVYPKGGGNDLPEMYFSENNPSSGKIQLKRFSRQTIAERVPLLLPLREADAVAVEPPIPFERVPMTKYESPRKFDYAFLCQSPGYTPRTADALIPIFEDYIELRPSPRELT
jgi:hypothetical protein